MLEAEEIRNFGIAVGHPRLSSMPNRKKPWYNARPILNISRDFENLYETGKEASAGASDHFGKPEALFQTPHMEGSNSLVGQHPTPSCSILSIPVVARQTCNRTDSRPSVIPLSIEIGLKHANYPSRLDN